MAVNCVCRLSSWTLVLPRLLSMTVTWVTFPSSTVNRRKSSTRISASPGRRPSRLLIQLKWTRCATPFGARILTSSLRLATAFAAAFLSNTDIKFKVGDRVCRRIPGHSNKLHFFFSGPYRYSRQYFDLTVAQVCQAAMNLSSAALSRSTSRCVVVANGW
jgi:hypothetical protein